MHDLRAVTTELFDGDSGWTATVELHVVDRVVELSVSGDHHEVIAQVTAWYADRSKWDPRNYQHVVYTGRVPAGLRAEFKRV